MATFLLVFVLTNIIFSLFLYGLLLKFDIGSCQSEFELFFYSLGLGPAFTVLLLYYSFLIIPHQSNLSYIGIVFVCYLFIILIDRKISTSSRDEKINLNNFISSVPQKVYDWFCTRHARYMLIFLFSVTIFIGMDFTNVLKHPIIGHDALVYGTMGKILFTEKSLDPIWIPDFSAKGFIYKIVTKPPSYSLLLAWENIIESIFSIKNDLYFKSVSIYYSILILSIQFYWLSKANTYLAMLGSLALMAGTAFFLTFLTTHLDSFRMFFIFVSWVYLAYSVKKNNLVSIVLLGIFSGLAAFIHTIGLAVAVLNCMVFFIFVNDGFKARFVKSILVTVMIILFGGSHQIFNIIWGRNWLF
ncbi:hypothetical protein ACFL0M_13565 [Thermodesulfobacteriota bacterium]